MAFEDGPFVQVACFCDTIIEDKSSVLSLIRIVDVLNREERGPDAPKLMAPVIMPLTMVLMLQPGEARGRGDIVIKIELPSGIKEEGPELTAHFEKGRGTNIVTSLQYKFTQEGEYRFWVYLDDQVLTCLPLRVKYRRIITGQR